jgi:hypothetical protein
MGFQNDVGDLSFTGERVVPGKTPQFLVLEHLVRYGFAARFASACKVLDAACTLLRIVGNPTDYKVSCRPLTTSPAMSLLSVSVWATHLFDRLGTGG